MLISCEELTGRLDDTALQVVDCRFELLDPGAGRQQYLAGHVPGACYADLDRDLAAPAGEGTGRHPLPRPSDLASTLGRLGISNSTFVVIYDQGSGAMAARLWWLLRWLGHENTALLDGGFARWRSLGLPLQIGDESAAAAHFEPKPRDDLVIETAEIVASGDNRQELRLVDARDSARFEGLAEPIDRVAGHIPGSVNLPYSKALNDDGTWKAPDDLRRLLAEVLGDGTGGPWSVMCGSGITACHLAVSGLMAGFPEPRVYVGSWSEWIADPSRPVATGSE